jgi:glycerophosphoryl diester phosphodiesterase
MAAFEKAIELGVTTLELDVVMTRDGVFAVHHDLRVNSKICRAPGDGPPPRGPLAEMAFSDLSQLDCGSRRLGNFPEQILSPGERIPRLEQVVDVAVAAPYPVGLSIELKQPIDGMPRPLAEVVGALIDLLRSRQLEERAIVQSKWGEVLTEVRNLAPDVDRAIVLRIASAKPWVLDGTATIVSRKHVYLDRREVRNLQEQGVRVIPWTVNKPKAIQKMMDWGVDGIITDYPDRALDLLQARLDKGRAAAP